ncbi:MAG: hypothetical protein A2Y66_08365 [Nitrospirae bacterium RBG_13_41_22]|nr:MAG: hypothetical protein A2Y66_08365 [Nitrospirae bacterium RBG_13_41_22]
MSLRHTKGDENTIYSSLWQREVRRDFCNEEIIHKISPIPSFLKRGIFGTNSDCKRGRGISGRKQDNVRSRGQSIKRLQKTLWQDKKKIS